MNPGKLDRRVTFGTFSTVKNANQDPIPTFTGVLTTWAQVKPYSGQRQLESGEEVITDTTAFTIRWRTDFMPTKAMRINYLDRYYTIHSVRDIDDRRRFYEILTKVADDANSES